MPAGLTSPVATQVVLAMGGYTPATTNSIHSPVSSWVNGQTARSLGSTGVQ